MKTSAPIILKSQKWKAVNTDNKQPSSSYFTFKSVVFVPYTDTLNSNNTTKRNNIKSEEIPVPFGFSLFALTELLRVSLCAQNIGFCLGDRTLYRESQRVPDTELRVLLGCDITMSVSDQYCRESGWEYVNIFLTPVLRRYRWYQVPVNRSTIVHLDGGGASACEQHLENCGNTEKYHLLTIPDPRAILIPSLETVCISSVAKHYSSLLPLNLKDSIDMCYKSYEEQLSSPRWRPQSTNTEWCTFSRPCSFGEPSAGDGGTFDWMRRCNTFIASSNRLWKDSVKQVGWENIHPSYHHEIEKFLEEMLRGIYMCKFVGMNNNQFLRVEGEAYKWKDEPMLQRAGEVFTFPTKEEEPIIDNTTKILPTVSNTATTKTGKKRKRA